MKVHLITIYKYIHFCNAFQYSVILVMVKIKTYKNNHVNYKHINIKGTKSVLTTPDIQ